MLERDFPEVHIIKGTGNWWYTKSMNEGFKYAMINLNPDFFLTLNDDIEIGEDYISSIIDAYNKVEDGSIMGSLSVTIEKSHRVTNSGTVFKNRKLGLMKHYIPFLSEVSIEKLSGIYKTETLPGRGILIPAKTLTYLNFFDEKFKQYHSDGDFCLRAAKKGYNVYISWDSVIYSHIKLTSSSSSFKKQPFNDFMKSFISPYSRNYIPSKIRFIWRHQTKVLMPFVVFISLLLNFKNYLFKKKIY